MSRAFSRAVRVSVLGSLARRMRFSSRKYSATRRNFASSVEANRAKSGWSRRVMLARVSECGRGPRFPGGTGFLYTAACPGAKPDSEAGVDRADRVGRGSMNER